MLDLLYMKTLKEKYNLQSVVDNVDNLKLFIILELHQFQLWQKCVFALLHGRRGITAMWVDNTGMPLMRGI